MICCLEIKGSAAWCILQCLAAALQVCLSMCELLVNISHKRVKHLVAGIQQMFSSEAVFRTL